VQTRFLLFLAAAALGPRIALVFVWIFGSRVDGAFDSWIVPLLGVVFLPWTTLAYAGMWSAGTNEVYGFEWFIVGLAFVIDLGSYAGGGSRRAKRD